jgi:hypothetical protein
MATQMKIGNEMIIRAVIDGQYGTGAFDKVKDDPNAVQELLEFAQSHFKPADNVKVKINQPETILKYGVYHAELCRY